MKATLEFTLPDEQDEHRTAVDAWKYRAVLDDLCNHLRRIYKHGDDENRAEFAHEIREKISELLTENELPL